MRKFLRLFPMIAIALVMTGSFAVPQYAEATTTPQANTGASAQTSSKVTPIDECSFTSPSTWAFGCFYGALGKFIWSVIIPVTGWALWLVGQVLDFALNLQFASDFFKSPAIAAGWAIIRDLCNMVFIFVLIYAGISTILNLNTANLKKVITGVIISALFINFSLYITRAIIDVSNVATAWFVQGVKNVGGGVGVSDSVQGALQMDKLIKSDSKPGEGTPIGLSTFVTGIAVFALNLVAIYMFFKVAFIFIARIVSFMFLLVTAPVGFVGGLGIDKLSKLSADWWQELRCQAFMAPMFFLMLYLTLYIVDQVQVFISAEGAGKIDPVTGSSFSPANYLMFAIIIMMLLKTLEVAEESGCKLGNQIAGALKGAAGLATGAIAMGTIGKATGAIAGNARFQSWAARSGVVGDAAMKTMMSGASSSFGAASSYKSLGISKLGIPGTSDAFKGADKGYAGMIKKEVEDRKKYAKEAFGKGVEGAANRQAYAAGLKGGIIGRVIKTNPILRPSRWGDTAKMAGSALGTATFHGTPGVNLLTESSDQKAGKEVGKEADKEYKKEAGIAAKEAMKKYNESLDKDTELSALVGERARLEQEIRAESEKLSAGLTKELDAIKQEEDTVNKDLARFNEAENTIDGNRVDNYEFQAQLAQTQTKLADVKNRKVEKEKEIKTASSPEIQAKRDKMEEIKRRYTDKIDAEMEKQIKALEARGVKLKTRDKDGIDAVISAGKKQEDEETAEKARKAMEKAMKDDGAPEEAKPKDEGDGGKEKK